MLDKLDLFAKKRKFICAKSKNTGGHKIDSLFGKSHIKIDQPSAKSHKTDLNFSGLFLFTVQTSAWYSRPRFIRI